MGSHASAEMTARRSGFRLTVLKSALFLIFLTLVCRHASAQQTRPDSLRRDTTRADSLKVVADSAVPPPVIVKHSSGARVSLANSVWEWDRVALLNEAAVSLYDLLLQLPGVATFRVGLFLQPEVVALHGQTRGGLQIWLDGYELDPLTEASIDLSRLELVNLQRVRIERRLDVTRIEISTLEPVEAKPQSRIEAGVGEPDVNLFRGLFLSPNLLAGPLGFAIERIDTDGFRNRENADVFSGWAKWAFIRSRFALQAEFRQQAFTRNPESPWPGESSRRDIIVRARSPITTGLVAEIFAGKSTFENDTTLGNTETPDSIKVPKPEADVLQYGARASFNSELFWVDASARVRDHEALPTMQVDAQAGARFSTFGGATASWSHANWETAGSAATVNLRGYAGPFSGVTAFGELSSGKRGGPTTGFSDTLDVFLSDRKAARIGLAIDRWGIQASAAFLKVEVDSTQTFGLPFDSTDTRFEGGELTGWEATGSVPVYFKNLTLYGHYTNWPNGTFPLYTPNQLWRAGLQIHLLPLKSGNLEILGRIEVRHRGILVAPERTGTPARWDVAVLPAYDQVDGYFLLRVMDVRLFIRAENMTNQPIVELPGRTINTPRFLYGMKWDFRN
jgi:hypothetical protein